MSFLVALRLEGKRCLVLGSSSEAARRARELSDAGAVVVALGSAPGPELELLAESGRITLEILQEVSAASKTDSSTIDSPTLTQRSAQSVVTTQSGETLVFGGMIRTERTFGTAGIPLLSKIPVVGGLFGNQVYTDKRTELILLITPKLIADVTQARDALEEIRRKMPGFRDLIPKRNAEPVAPK